MRKHLLVASVLVSAGYGCGGGDAAQPALADPAIEIGAPPASLDGGARGVESDGGGSADASARGDGATSLDGGGAPQTGGNSATTALPCNVQSLLQGKCDTCHSSLPVNGAPVALVTYSDLTARSRSAPAETEAQVALSRMQSTAAPMPPAGNPAPTATELSAFQAWVNAGAPQGACGVPDGGIIGAEAGASVDAGPSPYDTPTTCSSGKTSTASEGSTMQPGNACLSCHGGRGGAPKFSIGGTVYPTAHEPTGCEGVDVSGATVVLTDANGQTVTFSANSAGNFYGTASIATPFHAKVTYNGNTRAMSAAQTSGDCNSCHTETGANGAPGRIMLP